MLLLFDQQSLFAKLYAHNTYLKLIYLKSTYHKSCKLLDRERACVSFDNHSSPFVLTILDTEEIYLCMAEEAYVLERDNIRVDHVLKNYKIDH